MRHDVVLEGPAFRLRPVRPDDAATVLELRNDPERARFIHAGATTIAAQVRWIEQYLDRPGDWYWAVERRQDGRVEGFVGVYDASGTSAEWGRWVLRAGSLAAAESAWLVHEAAFGPLRLESVLSRTLADNRAVVAFHERYGADVLGIVPGYARIGDVLHDAVEARMTREAWASAGPRLLATAERAAVLVRRGVTAPLRTR